MDAPVSRADRLIRDAKSAARVRAYQTDPDVAALRVESVRMWSNRLTWIGVILGLGFTMVNVQQFAAGDAAEGSLTWWSAWLLDPMVSLVLIGILMAEQVTARYQVPMRVDYAGPWVAITKRFCLAATYVMNTWASWEKLDADGIVLHSVPPALVFMAAEAIPIARDRLTEAVIRAAQQAHTDLPSTAAETTPTGTPPAEPVNRAANTPVNAPVNGSTPAQRAPVKRKPKGAAKNGRRKFLGDYVNEARAAYGPGVNITPAWVREVTDCSRGLSTKVAATLRAELSTSTDNPASSDDPTPLSEVREAA